MARDASCVVLSAAKDLAAVRAATGGTVDGWDRAAPAALKIMRRRFAPVRRWSDAIRPIMPSIRRRIDHRKVLRRAQDDTEAGLMP
jgi:hypothetical protein